MWTIKRSALFKRQLLAYALDYKNRVNTETAERFIDAVGNAVTFVGKKPLACGRYMEAHKHKELTQYEFRKWHVEPFPHSIFFRLTDNNVILLEALYAHRMNTVMKLSLDLKN